MARAPSFSKIGNFLEKRLGYSSNSAQEAIAALKKAGMQTADHENQFVSHLKQKYNAGARGLDHNDEGLMKTLSSVNGIGGATFRAGQANKGLTLRQVAEKNKIKTDNRATVNSDTNSPSLDERLKAFKTQKIGERAAEDDRLSREYWDTPEVKGVSRTQVLDEEDNIRAQMLQMRAEREQAVADSRYLREKFGTGIGQMESNAARDIEKNTPLITRLKNWFKSTPVDQERKYKYEKIDKDGDTSSATATKRKEASQVPSNQQDDFEKQIRQSDNVLKAMNNFGGKGAVNDLVKTSRAEYDAAGKMSEKELAAKYGEGKNLQQVQQEILERAQRGPGLGNYWSGNGMTGKSIGVGLAFVTADVAMGDGRRSNAQLYSSPF